MTGTGALPMSGFYQFSYVTRNLDAAIEMLRDRFGIENYRRKNTAPWMEAVHAWTGDSMIEVVQLGDDAPGFFTECVPGEPGRLVLHHLGRRIADEAQWQGVKTAIDRLGLEVAMWVEAMDGDIQGAFVDTRRDLGIYSKYVYRKGAAVGIYDDIPRND